MSKTYLVQWTIDIEDVDSPLEAARQALEIQRDSQSIATVFFVQDESDKKIYSVDPEDEEMHEISKEIFEQQSVIK